MATSGSIDFTMTRDDIIKQALWLIGAIGESETVPTDTTTQVAFQLNMLVKAWQAEGLNLWTTQEATLFLTKSVATYNLNSSSGDNASDTVEETSLSAAASSSATVLTVTSSTDMAASDIVLIELDDGTLDSTKDNRLSV